MPFIKKEDSNNKNNSY